MIEDDFDIKKKVEEVLTETSFTEQRAAKLGVDELLKYAPSLVVSTVLAHFPFSGSYRLFTTSAYILPDAPVLSSWVFQVSKVEYSSLMDLSGYIRHIGESVGDYVSLSSVTTPASLFLSLRFFM